MNEMSSPTQILNDSNVPLSERDSLVAIAAARRVAYRLPLPIESVENPEVAKAVGNPEEYYRAHYAVTARAELGKLNELAVCDFDFAEMACRFFWEARYKIAFDPESPEAMSAVTGLVEHAINQCSMALPTAATEALHAFDAGKPFAPVRPAMEAYWNTVVGEG